MADLTTNSYNNSYLYSNKKIAYGDNSAVDTTKQQPQTAYGDNQLQTGISAVYNDKKLDPVKEKAKKDVKSNPVVSTLKAFIGEPVNIAIGLVPFLAVDRLLKWLPKGESFKESGLGKMTGFIDNLAGRLPKPTWLTNYYAGLSPTNFIKQTGMEHGESSTYSGKSRNIE